MTVMAFSIVVGGAASDQSSTAFELSRMDGNAPAYETLATSSSMALVNVLLSYTGCHVSSPCVQLKLVPTSNEVVEHIAHALPWDCIMGHLSASDLALARLASRCEASAFEQTHGPLAQLACRHQAPCHAFTCSIIACT
jgi:hypothetical protein